MARPKHHAQDPDAIEAFKRGLRGRAGQRQGVPPARHAHRDMVPGRGSGRAEEQDHEAMGEAGDATLASAPHDQRTKSAYIFGAICPQEGKAAGLVLPFCNTDTMNLHPAEIALHVAPGRPRRSALGPGRLAPAAEARASRQHLDRRDPIEKPGAQPQENVRQFMRDNWLSNRGFGSYDEIVDHCRDAWNKLVEQLWRIMSLALHEWAQGFRSVNPGITPLLVCSGLFGNHETVLG